jgi:protein TonB
VTCAYGPGGPGWLASMRLPGYSPSMKYGLFSIAIGVIAMGGPTTGAAEASKPAANLMPTPKKWVSGNDDYPTSAFNRHEEGTASFTVTVGINGRPKDCVITQSSGFPDLDAATCQTVLQRAYFRPATDENGLPIEAPFASRMNWRIPR